MSNIDSAIRDALSKEDAEFLARFESEGPIREVFGAFQGSWGLMNVFAAIVTFAMFGVFLYCLSQMFAAADTRVVVQWSVGAVISMLAVAMLKMYFWMEMNKNVVLREVKRLELQIARLASKP